jgi:hypothetical protein
MHAGGLDLAQLAQELAHQRKPRVGFQRQAWGGTLVHHPGHQTAAPQESQDFSPHTRLGFTGQGPTIDKAGAPIGNDVGLGSSGNGPDAHGGAAKEWMPPTPKVFGIVCFETVHNSGHRVHGVTPKLGSSAMSRPSAGLEFKPDAAFVGSDQLKACWLSHDSQIGFES